MKHEDTAMKNEQPVFWIIAGTTEGRKLVEVLGLTEAVIYVSLATDYGLAMLEEPSKLKNVHPSSGRLTRGEMIAFLKSKKPDCVIDTTHPYARKVTRDLKSACQETGITYHRILRPPSPKEDLIYVSNIQEAAAMCSQMEGKIFLTCGSKDIEAFTQIDNFKDRVIVRILPSEESLNKCLHLGFKYKQIICMQGSFSEELNMAMLNETGASILVTKDSGDIGGFPEKITAARKLGVTVIVIGRPVKEEGLSFTQITHKLEEDYGIQFQHPHQYLHQFQYPYFPLFVSLKDKKVIIFGAGKIGERRIALLAEFGALIKIIAPDISEAVSKIPGVIIKEERVYQKGDCIGADLVLAVTNNREVNLEIAGECQENQIPVSVADNQDLCSFYFPAIVKRGNMVVGLTSSGQDHARVKRVAQRLRQKQDELFE